MKVKYKKFNESAEAPFKKNPEDAGWDLTVDRIDVVGPNIIYYSGLGFEIPSGHVGLLFPRSSVAEKDIILTNCVGVIDSIYRGEVMAKFRLLEGRKIYEEGERFCQIIILPYTEIEWEEWDELSNTVRGDGGYGSTN